MFKTLQPGLQRIDAMELVVPERRIDPQALVTPYPGFFPIHLVIGSFSSMPRNVSAEQHCVRPLRRDLIDQPAAHLGIRRHRLAGIGKPHISISDDLQRL
ncbi:MAG TPA: hypothetical protein VGZ29_17195 [Terriglobia bacterium]|nr:hypothetical protein [Terriglobia bacterium]